MGDGNELGLRFVEGKDDHESQSGGGGGAERPITETDHERSFGLKVGEGDDTGRESGGRGIVGGGSLVVAELLRDFLPIVFRLHEAMVGGWDCFSSS